MAVTGTRIDRPINWSPGHPICRRNIRPASVLAIRLPRLRARVRITTGRTIIRPPMVGVPIFT